MAPSCPRDEGRGILSSPISDHFSRGRFSATRFPKALALVKAKVKRVSTVTLTPREGKESAGGGICPASDCVLWCILAPVRMPIDNERAE